ncbi:MAG: hypothetical protein CMJ67_09185 [Planctomycetaceae bacterium]|nr:hypothetical protein [Planctomycetaceae bacterium]
MVLGLGLERKNPSWERLHRGLEDSIGQTVRGIFGQGGEHAAQRQVEILQVVWYILDRVSI